MLNAYEYYDENGERKRIPFEDLVCNNDGTPEDFGCGYIDKALREGGLKQERILTLTYVCAEYGDVIFGYYTKANRIGHYLRKE